MCSLAMLCDLCPGPSSSPIRWTPTQPLQASRLCPESTWPCYWLFVERRSRGDGGGGGGGTPYILTFAFRRLAWPSYSTSITVTLFTPSRLYIIPVFRSGHSLISASRIFFSRAHSFALLYPTRSRRAISILCLPSFDPTSHSLDRSGLTSSIPQIPSPTHSTSTRLVTATVIQSLT